MEKEIQIIQKIILVTFQAKTGWDRPKKEKKKIPVRNRFYPTRAREFPK